MTLRRYGIGFALAVAVLSSLACRDTTHTSTVQGVPRIIEIGSNVGVAQTTVDFGPALLGNQVNREVLIRNDGRAAVTITDVQRSADFGADFSYPFTGALTIREDEQLGLPIRFSPMSVGDSGGTLKLIITGGDLETLEITLLGTGVDGKCAVSTELLEFGPTVIGDSEPNQLLVLNRSTLPWDVVIGDLDSGNGEAAAFEFGAGFTRGTYTVPPIDASGNPGSLPIPIEFKPKHPGEYSGTLSIPGPRMCPAEVRLHGTAVDQLLQCSPLAADDGGGQRVCRVDFGYVNPGSRAVREVGFTNLGAADITLSVAEVRQPLNVTDTPFVLASETTEFTVPANGGSIAIALAFAPGTLGAQVGTLELNSSDLHRPSLSVQLSGYGGGPDIEVHPAGLDFGEVAVDTFQIRRVTVANIGSSAAPGIDDNLMFVALGEGGTWAAKRAEVVGAGASSFSLVEWPPVGYDDSTGLTGDQSVQLRVKFFPQGDGLKEATLKIYSNDPDDSVLEVPLTGIGADLPPCDYEIRPPALNFGVVDLNRYNTLTFSIVNRSSNPANVCLVSMLDLSPATVAATGFTLVNGPLGMNGAVSIPAASRLDVPVRFAPKLQGTYTGGVDFYISSPQHPEGKVPLTGISQSPCLMIAPRELDFGTIGVSCSSRDRMITLYNVCSMNVVVSGIDLQPQGATDEFSVVSVKKPALPLTLRGGAQADFGVSYHPIDSGPDSNAVVITTTGTPSALIYVVPLAGTGAVDPLQTDVFSQSDQPKVDVLLIIDNSGSMIEEQTHFASNFAAFIKYANDQKVDYHIAATSVSLDNPTYECGRFVPLTGTNPRVITPSTPNKEQAFASNVIMGTNGTGTESLIRPGYLALSNPLINGHNAGFYRDEAKLAIVVVSDAMDQDPLGTPVSFYENFFLNLKGAKRRNDFTFSGIIPLQESAPGNYPGCSYDEMTSGSIYGDSMRVRTLAKNTGGVLGEICDPAWSKTLEILGTRVFGLRLTFFLSNVPDMSVEPEPITITVDGIALPQYGTKGEKRWDYNSASNAIEFDALAAPDPGATLRISYHVACL